MNTVLNQRIFTTMQITLFARNLSAITTGSDITSYLSWQKNQNHTKI